MSVYGNIDYVNKVVLDLGADIGTTAEFFLDRGAKLVIAIDGTKNVYKKLKRNAKMLGNVIPIFMFINKPGQIDNLLLDYKPDIVKSDIEGGEIFFDFIPRDIFRIPTVYIIGVHNVTFLKNCNIDKLIPECDIPLDMPNIYTRVEQKLITCNYRIIRTDMGESETKIHAERIEA